MTLAPLDEIRIGLLYPGEMGCAVAAMLRAGGHRIVTTLEGRGTNTARRCRAAGLEELPRMQDVIDSATVLLVLVPPAAAHEVAVQVGDRLSGRRRLDRLIYADLNSVSPQTKCCISAVFAGTQVDFVDGAILGLASQLRQRGVLYLSGGWARQVADLFAHGMRVEVLGDHPGQSSTLRMLLSGLTKGVIALFVEMALAAHRAGVLDRLLDAYRANYPGVMEIIERILPTYPRHAARRGQEVAEVEATLSHLDLCPTVAPGIRELIAAMGQCGWNGEADHSWSVPEVVAELDARRLLRRPSAASLPRFDIDWKPLATLKG